MTDRPTYQGLEPGQLLPDGSGEWLTIPPNSDAADQMLAVLAEESARSKAERKRRGFDA